MCVETTLKNIRCDTVACHKMAKFSINTSGYKGCIYLCEECFNKLYLAMQRQKKTAKNSMSKEKNDE